MPTVGHHGGAARAGSGRTEACKRTCDEGDAATCALLGGFYASGKWTAQSDLNARIYFAAAYEASEKTCGPKK